MRFTLFLSISCILTFAFASCTKKASEKVIIYGYFNFENDSLMYCDSLVLRPQNDSCFGATLLSLGRKTELCFEHHKEFVRVHSLKDNAILYSINDKSIHLNILAEQPVFYSPYLVNNTRFIVNKLYNVGNRAYVVSAFQTDVSSHSPLAYYTPEFGFICCIYERYSYKRIVDILEVSDTEKKLTLSLIDTVVKDTCFFANPYHNKMILPKYNPHK